MHVEINQKINSNQGLLSSVLLLVLVFALVGYAVLAVLYCMI